MLETLFIRNFALIDKLDICFSKQLNVLTGETGAGKTIIFDALSLILGERRRGKIIRKGEDFCEVTGKFRIEEKDKFSSIPLEGNRLILRRRIKTDGRTEAFACDAPVTTKMLEEVGKGLVDIHGQHSHQALLSSDYQLLMLDGFGKLYLLRKKMNSLWNRYKKTEKEKENLSSSIDELLKRRDFLEFQLNEIERVKLQIGEEKELEKEKAILSGAEQLSSNTKQAYEEIYEREGAILEVLSRILRSLEEMEKTDSRLKMMNEKIEKSILFLEETAGELRKYYQQIEFDPKRLDAVIAREEEITRLKRYGSDSRVILQTGEKIKKELASYEVNDTRLKKMENEFLEMKKQLEENSRLLSKKRIKTAKIFSKKVENELKALGMGKCRFRINFEKKEIGPNGADRIQFLIAPNPGEPEAALARIGSGGELARIMLALKSILAGIDRIPTLIFDEIDVGICGSMARSVGTRLKELSNIHQVICITHLPQIASLADSHFRVDKRTEEGRTKTCIKKLSFQERKEEIARMLSGKEITKPALRHAEELLKQVSQK